MERAVASLSRKSKKLQYGEFITYSYNMLRPGQLCDVRKWVT